MSNARDLSNNRLLTQGTTVASTSGTVIDFTDIPVWAKRITVVFSGVSISGISAVVVRVGPSSGVVSTGYVGAVASTTGGTVTALSSGFLMTVSAAGSTATWHGTATLVNLNGNVWVETGMVGDPVNLSHQRSAGTISLSGVLDRVRITTVNGTDTFDAGSINILYE